MINKNVELNNEELKECTKEILEIITNEYKENTYIILDYKRNHLTETMVKFKLEYYTDIYNKAIELLASL